MEYQTSLVQWKPCYRIIPSRFPPIQLFERVSDIEDLEAVLELESLTNERLLDEIGDIYLVPKEDRVCGPGSSPIMAAFTHRNPNGSRFSNGSWGVYYAGITLQTAIEETCYHTERFYRESHIEQAVNIDMRVYLADVTGEFIDIRSKQGKYEQLHDPDDYSYAQTFAWQIKQQNAWGVLYNSVRYESGECVGIFRPPVLSNCRQGPHLCYQWNGDQIVAVYKKTLIQKRTMMTVV